MRNLVVIFLFLISFLGYSQVIPPDAWVYFNDKPNAAAFFSNPLSELSQRALDRRSNQGIALDVSDAPIEQAYIDQITAATGIEVMAKSKWLNCLHIRGSVTDINALTSLSFVNHVHFADNSLNAKNAIPKLIHPVNKQLNVQVTYNYGTSANQIQMLNVNLLHQQNYTGSGKVIAVLDAGFPGVDTAAPFQNLIANNQILGGYDYVNKSTDFYTGYQHGTMVLSTMGGYQSGQLIGTAPDAKYYLYITEDINSENPVEESNWVEAAEEADRVGVDIITSSLGYFAFDNVAYGHTYADMTGNAAFASQGANIAFSKGIVVVASAGNDGGSSEPHVGVPAEATHVLAIGAVQANRIYATFSSVGPTFDNRIKPDVMAQGQNSVISDPSGTITTGSGTSFSGPIMAGSIASFWQAVPNLTNQQIVDFVKQSADRFANPNNQYGYGIPDFESALNSAQLSVNQNSAGRFLVYPNPVYHTLFVSFPPSFSEASISFYNTLGQVVYKKNIQNSETTLSLDNLNSGIYFYKIKSNSFVQTGKIIKN